MIRIATNLSPFEQAEAHLAETMFYDKWAPSEESSMSKPQSTFVPRWEDVQDDLEPDLRRLLMQKKKRKEAPTLEFRPLMAESSTSYEGVRGPHAIRKGAPDKDHNIKVWCASRKFKSRK